MSWMQFRRITISFPGKNLSPAFIPTPMPVCSASPRHPRGSKQPPGHKIPEILLWIPALKCWASVSPVAPLPTLATEGTSWETFWFADHLFTALAGFFKCPESFKVLRQEHQSKQFQQHLGLVILKLIQNSLGVFTHMLSSCLPDLFLSKHLLTTLFIIRNGFFVSQG